MAQVVTVNGPISPDELGITMCHVHLLSVITVTEQSRFVASTSATEQILAEKPITMDILGELRRHCYSHKDILRLGDVDEMSNEIMYYKRVGGRSIVECSLVGMGRDPVGLKKISGATGVNIVCPAGWYIAPSHPDFVKVSSIEVLCDHIVRELTVGIGTTGIRAGVIKVALSGVTPDKHFTGDEEKVLRAAARAQAKTGAALDIHPCHHYGLAKPFHTYVAILKQEGANLGKCYMSHLELWCPDVDYQKSVLDSGVNIAFDQFGIEYYGEPGKGYPPDRLRVEGVVKLVKAGYVNQIVLSNEVAFKISLRKYGGYGYAHVLEDIVPEFRFFGLTEEQINTMLVDNPKRLLAF